MRVLLIEDGGKKVERTIHALCESDNQKALQCNRRG